MKLETPVIIFLGPPGSGKGSISQLCVTKLGWYQLSTGSLCRKHIAEQTEIGKVIDAVIKSGKLIDDSLIVTMVEEWLSRSSNDYQGIILDGFPRTVAQAQALETILQKMNFGNVAIVRLLASDEVIIKRLSGRFVCQNKDCQRVYSALLDAQCSPKKTDECDSCRSILVRRSDDNPMTVHDRLKTYQAFETPLLDFYKKIGHTIAEINVEKPLSLIFDEFTKLLSWNSR